MIWLISIAAFVLGAFFGSLAARQRVTMKMGTIEIHAASSKETIGLWRAMMATATPQAKPAVPDPKVEELLARIRQNAGAQLKAN